MASRREKNANGPSPGADDEEDDYMTMVIQDPIQKETSLQRAARLKREARERGFMKSKAQLAKEAEQAREKALSTSLFDAPRTQQSKGLAMMARMGFTGGGLGKQSGQGKPSGITEPISVTVKDNRGGIGLDAEKRRRAEESGEGQPAAKAAKLVDDIDPAAYRERMSRERLVEKLERQITAAQRVAATLDGIDIASEESEDERRPELRISKRRLKTLPKEYRSYIRRLQSEDREKRARIQRERAMLTSRFDRDLNGDEDDDDLTALGRKLEEYVEEEGLDDTDEELEEFINLDTDEQLRSVVVYLRKNHNYCFWCKMAYPDEGMEGCPGTTEEDHD